ncbi:hypothetical protein ACIGXA_10670 [Streptomyces fildesensis]|uniref:Uncharacterized protein n=1 Tax=Streptomyces fildesensis TaxID=375757 RepID=A0ABW8C3I8_9ACTN
MELFNPRWVEFPRAVFDLNVIVLATQILGAFDLKVVARVFEYLKQRRIELVSEPLDRVMSAIVLWGLLPSRVGQSSLRISKSTSRYRSALK